MRPEEYELHMFMHYLAQFIIENDTTTHLCQDPQDVPICILPRPTQVSLTDEPTLKAVSTISIRDDLFSK